MKNKKLIEELRKEKGEWFEKCVDLTKEIKERNAEVKQEIDIRLKEWAEDRKKIMEDKYQHLLFGKNEDYQVCQIVEQELKELIQKLGLEENKKHEEKK